MSSMAIGLAACSSSCAVDLAQGRPGDAPGVAMLVTTDAQTQSGFSTDIRVIDGVKVDGSKFKLVVGRHAVEVEAHCWQPGSGIAGGALVGAAAGPALGVAVAGIAHEVSRRHCAAPSLKACFIARPEHTYEVRTFAEGGYWRIEVVDQTSTYDVKSPCKTASHPG
jgi:hypothetical protein